MEDPVLIPHLFRTEFSKISAVLTKRFGIAHIETAEDITSETFLAALESWPYNGIPKNPAAWLYTVARHKAINHINRDKLFSEKVVKQLRAEEPGSFDIDLSEKNISDSQLQMLFALCHPSISTEAQIGLSLRILCGFGIDEIASAFLTNKETINKRLFRAKQTLKETGLRIGLPSPADIGKRLDTVLTTLYLLFSEGYYSEVREELIREELCREAIRLTGLLTLNDQTDLPGVNALLALMYFQASRLAARKDGNGEVVLYDQQDDALWDQEMISRGAYYLKKASVGDVLSKYHLEAGIAWWHTVKEDTTGKWENILQLYNRLLQIEYSPLAALNRTYALSRVKGNSAAIPEAEKLALTGNHFYFILLGELYTGTDQEKAADHFRKALQLAKSETDKKTILKKLAPLL